MQELITTLEKLLARNFIDYALVIIPIVISLIAIALSIVTTQKQNRIALFEKRYDAYSNLLKLKAFSQMLIENDYSFSLEAIIAAGKIPDIEIKHRCREVLNNFQAFFNSREDKSDINYTVRETLFTVRHIELSLHALIMLYSKKLSCKEEDAHKKITSIFEGFATLMIWIVNQQGLIDDKVRIDFVSNINAFFDKYADIFEKGTRL